ncbi:MAG: carboxyl-terminal protease, partial [Maribacter sp.]
MKKVIGILSLLLILSCGKDKDLSIPNTINPDPNAGVDVQDFMWKAMNFWYFWQADVSDLADDRFVDSVDYTEFLASETDPGIFFDNKLLFTEDRFSFYSEDYKELTQSFSGISRSNGLEFGLVRFQGSDELFGYVWYI